MKHQLSSAPTVKNDGHIFKNDLIFILILLLTVSTIGLCVLLLRTEGDAVTVTVDGQHQGTYSLARDRTVEIVSGEQGEHRNVLIIRDGEAYVSEATCPDGICAAHSPISRSGESIVCLPHRVVITVRTSGDTSVPDVIA